jgi:formate dehydrogenase
MDKFISQTDSSLKKKKRRWKPKGRQAENKFYDDVSNLFKGTNFKRDELIEYLHILQDNYGVLYDKHLVALSTIINLPLAEIYEVATFYAHFNIVKNSDTFEPLTVVRVCESLTCELFGAQKLLNDLKNCENKNIKVVPGPCMGRCDVAPTVCVGKNYVDKASVNAVQYVINNKNFETTIPKYISFEEYKKDGGYKILQQVKVGQITNKKIISSLKNSGLKGKGGAGFPTGIKWDIVSKYSGKKYVAVNGDEGEPGTFKDRTYLEKDPHRFLEGALIASLFIKASNVYIYMRDEYPSIIKILNDEILKLEKEGIISHGHIVLRRGAGAYICGEESAMIESIEGKRGLPRHRPPYVAEVGLFNSPTLTNNLETLFWIRDILEKGPNWFADKGTDGKKGFHSFSVSGRVKNPGVKVAPAGITIQEIIDDYCGGMEDNHIFKGYLPGGASGGILPAKMNNIPLDYGSKELTESGCFLGSAAIVILSDKDDMKDVALNLLKFFEEESCGQCTPCRVGTEKTVKLMKEKIWNKAKLADLSEVMSQASICGLGQAATNPLNSVLKYFSNEISHE